MKVSVIIFILCWSSGMVWAQEKMFAGIPSDNVIHTYVTKANMYSALFSGKTVTPYDRQFINHPYFESNTYISGTLDYNGVMYKDVLMRFDLFRNELTVISPERPYDIVLDQAKFNYAIVNGTTIVLSVSGKESKQQFLVLLHNGMYPVVRKYAVGTEQNREGRTAVYSFRMQRQYAIYINGVPRAVKNKNSVLKLFPDKRKELNEFAKQHKLNFKNQIEQSIVDLVTHYENLKERE